MGDIQTFRPIETPHVTVFNDTLPGKLGTSALQKLVYPIPSETEASIELPVRSVEVYHRKWRSSIAITLDDPEERFYREHLLFRQRFRDNVQHERLSCIQSPHVTLGRIAPEFVVSDVHALVRSLLPRSLRFEAAIFEPLPAQPQHAEKANIKPRNLAITDIPVRTIQPGTIPRGFLAALQRTAIAGS